MSGFSTSVDIANSALQKLGAQRVASLAESSLNANEVAFVYDKVRRAELRRNVWRFAVRRVILRAVGTAFPTWDSGVTYGVGAFVAYGGINYISIHVTNLNQNPATATSYWSVYIGNTSQKVTFSAWASGTTYAQGAIVTGSDGLLYLSLTGSNTANDPTTDTGTNWVLYFGSFVASAWNSSNSYYIGELVFDVANAVYASTMNGNTNNPSTGTGWATIACTVAPIVIPWPAGTGPVTDSTTRNVFVLPNGFLRQAPADPRAGETSVLGLPSNLSPTDWLFEGGYLISRSPGPIMLRFAADVAQVTLMDDLFCEGLACRIAFELCERLTNSTAKLQSIGAEYKTFMGEARIVNGIETSSTEPPLDDFIAVRF